MAAAEHAPADAFGRAAEQYERARPGWPAEAIDLLVGQLGLEPGATVVDLGAGTGKLTRALAPRFGRVLAIEPDAAMRDVLARVVPRAEALAGRAETIPLADSSVDAIFVAEAFHWFDGPAALAEIARVLRPRGGLGLLWNANAASGPGTAFEPAAPDEFWALHEHKSLAKRPEDSYASGLWKRAFADSAFRELQTVSFPNELVLDRDGVVEHMSSWSVIAGLPDEERAALVAELRLLLDPATTYRRRLRTDVYWTTLAD